MILMGGLAAVGHVHLETVCLLTVDNLHSPPDIDSVETSLCNKTEGRLY
jgi:hypothetical protein